MTEKEMKLVDELDVYKGQWFVLNCKSGHEEKVRNNLLQKIETTKLQNDIFDVRIFKTPVADAKTKKITEKNKFPGYIFINLIMTDTTWFTVRNTQGVTGFIGSSGKGTKPFPLTAEEIVNMLNSSGFDKNEKNSTKVESSKKVIAKKEKVVYEINFNERDTVIVLGGPFAEREGKVIEINQEKGTAIIEIDFFGRITPLEEEFKNLKLVKRNS